jgi:hypothetical protein
MLAEEAITGRFYLGTEIAGLLAGVEFLPGFCFRLRLLVTEQAEPRALFDKIAGALRQWGIEPRDYQP